MLRLSPTRKRGAVSYGDVTSANVVGYQLIEVQNVDFALFTPTFKEVGGNGLDLTSITVCDAEGTEIEPGNTIQLQIMESDGGYTTTYSYSPILGDGWNIEGTPVEPTEVMIKAGEAFCVLNTYGDVAYLKVSGEVDLVNMNKIPNQDFYLWGNATPISIDLTDVKVVDESGEEIEPGNTIQLQVMESNGGYTTTYSYSPILGDGWNIEGTPVEPTEVVIKPGDGFCALNTYGEEVYLKLPNPLNYTLPKAD